MSSAADRFATDQHDRSARRGGGDPATVRIANPMRRPEQPLAIVVTAIGGDCGLMRFA
jgi:hypothetical protein